MDFSAPAGQRIVGIAGTFDVANYGDLLFPLIAQAQLEGPDGAIRVLPFAPTARSASEWPFAVQPTSALAGQIDAMSALLVGGGHLLRFDAPYPIAVPDGVSLPDDYWLNPAIAAVGAGVPLIWNAVSARIGGFSCPEREGLLAELLVRSRIVAVRDTGSRDFLQRIAPAAELRNVPDTAFSLSRIWPFATRSPDFEQWRARHRLGNRYTVVQADRRIARHHRAMRDLARQRGAQLVVVPICLCHGDSSARFPAIARDLVRADDVNDPQLLAEILAGADMVIATSLHACITALSYGVAAVRVPYTSDRKFELLDGFEGICLIDDPAAVARLAHRSRGLEARVIACQDELDVYWREVRLVVAEPRQEGPKPVPLQAATPLPPVPLASRLRRTTARLVRGLLDHWRSASSRFAEALTTTPAPPPAPPLGRPVLNLAAIAAQDMEREPYGWMRSTGLFSGADAAALAKDFPTDRYRVTKGYDGEKGYKYWARSLIHMGADRVSGPAGLTPEWLAFAQDLLTPAYRSHMSAVTGLDLAEAPMEANLVQYGPGAWLGPHVDLREKIATQIFYFNAAWDSDDGGCLQVLARQDARDPVATILPIVGSAALLVRSDDSWHAVSPVRPECRQIRRSLNVTFHLPGAVSTMWPPKERPRLRNYP